MNRLKPIFEEYHCSSQMRFPLKKGGLLQMIEYPLVDNKLAHVGAAVEFYLSKILRFCH